MKTTVRNIGVAERRVIDAVLNEIPPSKTNRALVKNLRSRFNIKDVRHEINAIRAVAIQAAMDKTISANLIIMLDKALAKASAETPITSEARDILTDTVERVVRTVAGPGMLQNINLSWDEILEANEPKDYEVDKTDLKAFRKSYDEKEDWAWDKENNPVPPPSALHEILANLDEALDNALKE